LRAANFVRSAGGQWARAKASRVEQFLAVWTVRIAELTDAFAAIIILLASLEAAVRAGRAFLKFGTEHHGIQAIRFRFGRWLSLALDFLIASDVLRTSVSPSWTAIGQLGAIVAIRIVITYALGRETGELAPAASAAPPAT